MALSFSGLYNRLKSGVSSAYNAVKSVVTPKTNTSSGSGLSSSVNQAIASAGAPKSQPLVSAGNVIGAGGIKSSSSGGSGAVLNTNNSGYSYSAGTSSGSSTGNSQIDRLINAANAAKQPVTLASSLRPDGNGGHLPSKKTITIGDKTYELNNLTSSITNYGAGSTTGQNLTGGTTQGSYNILGGQQGLPNSLSPTSRSAGLTTQPDSWWQRRRSNVESIKNTGDGLMGGISNAFNWLNGNVRKNMSPFFAESPPVVADPNVASTTAPVSVNPQDTTQFIDNRIIQDTMGNYDMNTNLNPPGETNVLNPDSELLYIQSPNGTTSVITQDQYNQNPEYWDSLFASGQLTPVGAEPMAPPVDEMALDEMAPQEPGLNTAEGLKKLYTEMQAAAGIPEIISQIKEAQNQQLAAKRALDTVSEEIMNDPDYSQYSKEKRISYLTGQSAAGVAYRDTTSRLEALAGLLNQANSEVQSKISMYAPLIQNAFTAQQGPEYSFETAGDNAYVFNKSTGQFTPVSGTGKVDKSQQEIINALNKSEDWANWQTVKKYTSVMQNTMDRFKKEDGTMDWGAFSNDDPAIRQFATAMVRVQDPISSRLADGGDSLAGNSIADRLELELKRFAVGANATPVNLQSAWNNAVRTLNGTWEPAGRAAEQQIRSAYGNSGSNNDPLGLGIDIGGSGQGDMAWSW